MQNTAIEREYNDLTITVKIYGDELHFMGHVWIPPDNYNNGKFIRMCGYSGTRFESLVGKDCFLIMFHDWICDNNCNDPHYYHTWRGTEIFKYFKMKA